jgi:hypothetical protein
MEERNAWTSSTESCREINGVLPLRIWIVVLGCGCGNESISLKTDDLAARIPAYTRNSACSTRMAMVPSSNHNSGIFLKFGASKCV